MKREIYGVGGFILIAVVLYGYSQILPTCDAGNMTTNETVSNMTIATTTTTTEESTTTTTGPDEDGKPYKSCKAFCKYVGYAGGGCRVSGMECRKHLEVKSPYGSHMCTNQRVHTCCCETDESV